MEDNQPVKIRLTIDDGPNNHTERFAQKLADNGIVAAFFVNGMEMARYPKETVAIMKHGHEIGNHGYTHGRMTKMTQKEARQELIDTQFVAVSLTGITPVNFRPPFLSWNSQLNDLLKEIGLTLRMPMMNAYDANQKKKVDYEVLELDLKRAKRLRHVDLMIHCREHTLDNLDDLIQWYLDRNCEFVPEWPE